MSAVDLNAALALVERHGIAPLARVTATRPKSIAGWSAWQAQVREVEALAAAKLAEHGATVTNDYRGATIRFAGYRASSTMGVSAALQNWRKRVALELARREREAPQQAQDEQA